MIDFYYALGPNPDKVALFFEEARLEFTLHPIDTRRGEQFAPAFLAINPNAKLPAIVDGAATVFDSNAILLYLAEKTGEFLTEDRGTLYSWLMFVATGVGPYSGQSVHFTHFAPDHPGYASNRYQREVERHYSVLDARLGQHRYMLGETYTIVDMSLWGWARRLPFILDNKDAWSLYPHVKRLVDEIEARPAARAALALGSQHPFKREFDDEARIHLFPQNRPRHA